MFSSSFSVFVARALEVAPARMFALCVREECVELSVHLKWYF